MSSLDSSVAMVYAALGRAAPSLGWSKLEIAIGLAAVGAAMAWMSLPDPPTIWAPPLLVAFGGYLALAGHRSHLYDAMARQTTISWSRSDAESARAS